jgi:hypothetical protein
MARKLKPEIGRAQMERKGRLCLHEGAKDRAIERRLLRIQMGKDGKRFEVGFRAGLHEIEALKRTGRMSIAASRIDAAMDQEV